MAVFERRRAACLACIALLPMIACTLVSPLPEVAEDRASSETNGTMGVGTSKPPAITAMHMLVAGEVCSGVETVCGEDLVCGPEKFCTKPCSSDDDCPGAAAGSCRAPGMAAGMPSGHCARNCDLAHPQEPVAPWLACAAGYSCDLVGEVGTHECVVHSGTRQLGAACNTASECAAGLTCAGGTCAKWCTTDADCEIGDEQAACIEGRLVGLPWEDTKVCASTCDPSAPQEPRKPLTACGAGLTCAPIGDVAKSSDSPLGFMCIRPGSATEGHACKAHAECASGLFCDGEHCLRSCRSDSDCGDALCAEIRKIAPTNVAWNACVACDKVNPAARSDRLHACPEGSGCHPRFANDLSGCYSLLSSRKQLGDACVLLQECGPGLGCYGGVCGPYCYNDADCDMFGAQRADCQQANRTDTNQPIADTLVCRIPCDPVKPDNPQAGLVACGEGASCVTYWRDGDVIAASTCISSEGGAAEDEECNFIDGCDAGMYCGSSVQVCVRYCRTDDDCSSGRTCIEWPDPVLTLWDTGMQLGGCVPRE
jgi:hypothetical protein